MPFDEAYHYYLHALNERFGENVNSNLFGKSKDFFERVFHLTGGRMHFIEKFISQVSGTKTPIDTGSFYPYIVKGFAPVAHEYGSLTSIARRNNIFSRDDFIKALNAVVNSGCGYYDYDQLCAEIGEEQVSALIAKNVLHYRPESDMSRDLVPYPKIPVVTAPSEPALRAMELIIQNKKDEKLELSMRQSKDKKFQ